MGQSLLSNGSEPAPIIAGLLGISSMYDSSMYELIIEEYTSNQDT
jgi:hypothetical protein